MINQDIDILDLNEYNLSYDFLNSVIGIDVNECYPYKNGFSIIDQNGNNYLIFKILERDVEKYIQIFDVFFFILILFRRSGRYFAKRVILIHFILCAVCNILMFLNLILTFCLYQLFIRNLFV